MAPPYGEPLRGPLRNGLGTASLILGIASIPFGVLIVLPILAIVFGFIGMARARRGEASNSGVALAGTITGGIGLIIGIIGLVLIVRVVTSDSFSNFLDCDKNATTTEQHDSCARQFSDELVGKP